MSRTIVAAKLDEGSSRALANRSRPIFVEEKVVVEDGFVEMGFADFVQVRCHVGVGEEFCFNESTALVRRGRTGQSLRHERLKS